MKKNRLYLSTIPENFNLKEYTPLGPWCFMGKEEIYKEFDHLHYIQAFESYEETNRASEECEKLFFYLVDQNHSSFNKQNSIKYPREFWGYVLGGWLNLLIQLSYHRYRYIKKFIEHSKNKNFECEIFPLHYNWEIEETTDISNLYSTPAFDWWLSSVIVSILQPSNWSLTPFVVKENQHHSTIAYRTNVTAKPNLFSSLFPMRIDKIGFKRVERILLNLILMFKKARNYKKKAPKNFKYDPLTYFDKKYLEVIERLMRSTIPATFTNNFHSYNNEALKYSYKSGKIRITNPDIHDDRKKIVNAHALLNNEIVMVPQHGSFYGIITNKNESKTVEYQSSFFITTGWKKESNKVNCIFADLPSPYLSDPLFKYERKSDTILFLDTINNVRKNPHVAGQLSPCDVVLFRREKVEFLKSFSKHLRQYITYRPHGAHLGLNDEKLIKDTFPEIKVNKQSQIIDKLTSCKLVLMNHYGTTLHTTLANNIPTITYWHKDKLSLEKEAVPYFDLLHKCGILHYTYHSASKFINENWINLEEWWQSKKVQEAREMWAYQYARRSDKCFYEWAKFLMKI